MGAIGDYVWLDLDRDGAQEPAEAPVAGATVQLLTPDGTLLADQVTGVDGRNLFDQLPAGIYRVQVVFAGATYTIARAPGVSNAANSDVDSLGDGVGRTGLISLDPGEIDLTWDAGIVVEVLGVQIESTTPAPVEGVTLDTLPFTGSPDARLPASAAVLLTVGAMVLLSTGARSKRGRVEPSPTGWANR